MQNLDQRRAIVMFSAMARALMESFHHLIGFHTLLHLHGHTNPPLVERMVSGSCTGLHQNSQTLTGRTAKSRKISLRPSSSGLIVGLMVSVSMWRTALQKISQSHFAVCLCTKVLSSAATRARASGAIATKSLLSIKSGARSLINMTHHALQLLKPMFIQSVFHSMQAQRL